MERHNFSSGSKIRRGAADIHRDAESRGTEKNYYFRHSALAPRLLKFYRNSSDWIVPCANYQEITPAVENYLEDLSGARAPSFTRTP